MARVWSNGGKRVVDLVCATLVGFLLTPIFIIVAALIRLRLGSPVLFRQERLGRDMETFKIYKFRTMTASVDDAGELLPDENRLTDLGRFLRRSSIDELPQIFNVLKGQMSFIGPRPTLPSYRELLHQNYPKRFDALPGLTSLPAVRGRNALEWDEKFVLDVEYVEKLSFLTDLRIALQTIPVVFSRQGVSKGGMATTTRYDHEQRVENGEGR